MINKKHLSDSIISKSSNLKTIGSDRKTSEKLKSNTQTTDRKERSKTYITTTTDAPTSERFNTNTSTDKKERSKSDITTEKRNPTSERLPTIKTDKDNLTSERSKTKKIKNNDPMTETFDGNSVSDIWSVDTETIENVRMDVHNEIVSEKKKRNLERKNITNPSSKYALYETEDLLKSLDKTDTEDPGNLINKVYEMKNRINKMNFNDVRYKNGESIGNSESIKKPKKNLLAQLDAEFSKPI